MDSSQFRQTKVESAAIEDLLSDTSLHQELEFSLNCTELKDTTNRFQAISAGSCKLMASRSPLETVHAAFSDVNRLVLNKHPYACQLQL